MSCPDELNGGETVSDLENWQERLQSPVKTYNINEPMTLETFEGMTRDLQKEYLQKLRTQFGFGPQLVADMLGTDKSSVLSKARALGLDWSTARLNTKNAEIVAAREQFLSGYLFPPRSSPEKPGETPPEPPAAQELPLLPGPPPEDKPPVTADLISFRVELTGPMAGVMERLKSFAAVFGDGPVTVTVEAGGRPC